MSILIFDSEVYRNYYLASFRALGSGEVYHFEMYPPEIGIEGRSLDILRIRAILDDHPIITFNGNHYDMPLLGEALSGATPARIKELSDKIILNNLKPWQLQLEAPQCDHVDLIEVAPGIAGLKLYAARLHARSIRELPIDPSANVTPEQRATLRTYCEFDTYETGRLYTEGLKSQIELRTEMSDDYEIDLRSKSDAQIAEAVIRRGVEHRLGRRLDKHKPDYLAGTNFHYEVPKILQYAYGRLPIGEALLKEMGLLEFVVSPSGVVMMPKAIEGRKVKIGDGIYRMGIGGLHSSEKRVSYRTDDTHVVLDRDVASYYPAIILNCGLQPESMGKHFTDVYKNIVDRRLAAKARGDKVTADSLKITINGSFGKLGSPYSLLYSPRLLIQVTLTGQLALLLLIERLEQRGIRVVSANTDGILIHCRRDDRWLVEMVFEEWESYTGFVTEEAEYQSIYHRDVNNYIAIKPDDVKMKGAYVAPSLIKNSAERMRAMLMKNPTNEISIIAAIEYLTKGTPVSETVLNCKDVTKFVCVRQVKGGAVKNGALIGKVIRWYYARGETGAIHYKVNNYTVPRTEGARPLMDLPDALPADLDFGWYVCEAMSMLADMGAEARVEEMA